MISFDRCIARGVRPVELSDPLRRRGGRMPSSIMMPRARACGPCLMRARPQHQRRLAHRLEPRHPRLHNRSMHWPKLINQTSYTHRNRAFRALASRFRRTQSSNSKASLNQREPLAPPRLNIRRRRRCRSKQASKHYPHHHDRAAFICSASWPYVSVPLTRSLGLVLMRPIYSTRRGPDFLLTNPPAQPQAPNDGAAPDPPARAPIA